MYVDFYFFEVLELIAFVTEGKIFEDYPTLKEYHARIEAMEVLKDKIKEQRTLLFNGKRAKINNI